MVPLVFASNNANKKAEIENLLPSSFQIKTLSQAGFTGNLCETGFTLEANAFEKANTVAQIIQTNVFSEDSGLFVAALDEKPGVNSARYAGAQATDAQNISFLLQNLGNETNRKAYFKTVIAFINSAGDVNYFSGMVNGTITKKPVGHNGFGYDSIFVPNGSDLTFAQMTMLEKNEYSHRKKAVQQFVTYLKNMYGTN